MTAVARVRHPNTDAFRARRRAREHRIELRGVSHRLRLVRVPGGWLASVDAVEGPTLGSNRSPYLAVSRALEPIGGGLIDAMLIVADLHVAPQASATGQLASTSATEPRS